MCKGTHNLLTVLHPDESTEYYTYDALGKVTSYTDRYGKKLFYSYDVLGQMTALINEKGQKMEYVYDLMGRILKEKDFDGHITSYTYDAAGQLGTVTDPRGNTTNYKYDVSDNLTEVLRKDPVSSQTVHLVYEYNKAGQIKKLTDALGRTETYEYDRLGRMVEKTDREGLTTTYACNSQGMLQGVKWADGRETTYSYTPLRRLNKVEDWTGTTRMQYDKNGQISSIAYPDDRVLAYTYDTRGNRIHTLYPNGEEVFCEFDGLDRLTKLTQEQNSICYDYDRLGNLTEQIQNGLPVRNYTYDASNRLASAEKAGEAQAFYTYNGLGYRTGMNIRHNGQEKKVSYTLDYSRIYDNLLEKHSDHNTETYLWGTGLEGVRSEAGNFGWYMKDPLGSIVRKMSVTSLTGEMNVASVADYDEFGNVTTAYGAQEDDFGYNGFLRDTVAGTWYAQARQYRSETGSFDGLDRFGGDITMPETLNPYVYCVQSPFRYTDKSGYYFGVDDAIAALVGAVGNGAGQLIGDLVTSRKNGQWTFSSWQTYTGAFIGGAAGGVTTLYAGPIAGGAVTGGVSRMTTEGLTWASNPSGYNKTLAQAAGETVIDAGMGALSGAVSKVTGKITQKVMQTKGVQNIISRLRGGGKVPNMIANQLSRMAEGVSSEWSQTMKGFRENRSFITKRLVGSQKKALERMLISSIPFFIAQEVWGKAMDKITPSKFIWSRIKKAWGDKAKDWWKKYLGLSDGGTKCAAAS